MPLVYLPDRGVIGLSGADAQTFLNGLVTADMAKVSPQRAGFAALLSPQGKILFDFLIAQAIPEDGGGYYLDCPRSLVPDLIERLMLYRLRSQVVIDDLSDALGVAAEVGDSAFDPEDYLTYADPRLPALGRRVIGERAGLAALGGDPVLYHGRRIELGVPEGGKDFAYNDAYPHDTLMDQLSGVDFAKGCYVGQEVVSRMQHRGTARTRIVPVSYEGGFAPVEGVEVVAGGKSIGRAGSQYQGSGLAMLRLDRLADALAQGQTITAGGIGLSARKPAFATFSLPGVDG